MKSSRTSTCPRTLSSATGDEPHNSSRPSILCSEPSEHLKTELKPARGTRQRLITELFDCCKQKPHVNVILV
uniref:Uncharacterized protein n=1 Tax=Anguilla anguilla TaxID=7936 RepID=A0A0E9RWU6_ANGAN